MDPFKFLSYKNKQIYHECCEETQWFHSASRRKQPQTIMIWLMVIICLLGSKNTVNANPLKDPNICGRPTCLSDNFKFNYAPGTVYTYKYSVGINTLFDGTSKNESTLHIESHVNLEFISKCEGIIQFSQVSLTEKAPDESKDMKYPELPQAADFNKAITALPLRFSYSDGIILELCPGAKEPSWVLNFKRGLLSSFQNSMKRFDVDHSAIETDSNGDCDTTYTLLAARNTSLIILKKKDMSTCTSRYKHHSILQTTPYIFRSNSYQAVPLMNSTSRCNLSVDHHIYDEIICIEEHTFQPFSRSNSGAKTIIRQSLKLIQELNSTAKEPETVERRSSLLFDHDITQKSTSKELKAARDLIKAMCRLNTDDVQPDFPDAFTKFVHTARLLSYSALIQVYNRSYNICSSGKKHVTDALPLLGSNAAVAVMRDIILKNGVPIGTIHEWLFALAFVPRPDLDTLNQLAPLLNSTNADAQYMLGVSAVVHTYCKADSNCQMQPIVINLLQIIEDQARVGCHNANVDRKQQEKTLVALKALGNMGVVSQTMIPTLQSCIENDNLDMSIRISAIEAHRRLPCEMGREYFLQLFRDQTVDSELRIAAYLEVMKCPNYVVIKTIKHSLNEEEVNQVGSFVWSHLQNLLKSSIPSRVEIQGLLQDKNINRKFSSDVRKFSHNFEGSMFFDEYNAGGNYETSLIFSPKSYLPRSAMLNLTVDLFGESINVFEVAGRMEGFEHYVESMFGPNGPFSNNKIREGLQKFRFLRSSPNEVLASVNDLPNPVDNNFNDPKISLALKIFGNELKYHTFAGKEEIRDAISAVNPKERLKQLLSGKEISFNKAALFMDTSYTVPTGAGLPINLNAIGTAAVNLKLSGSFKAADFMETGELDVEGKIRPSVALDVVGTMGVDAYYTSTGIKLKTNLYSSTAVEGQVKIRGAKLVSVSFNLPKEKTEIISAQSELIIIRGTKEERQAGIKEGRVEEHACSWPSLDRTLGLNFCADFQFPNASQTLNASSFFLNGPAKFGLSLQKADPTAKQYLLEYKWEATENATVISLVFDTPGSNQKRELSAKLNLDMDSQNLTLLLQSAESKFQAHGKYKNTENEKYITFGLNINGTTHFDAEIGLKKREGKHGFTYQPRVYLAINKQRIAELLGIVKWVTKKGISQWDVDLEFYTKNVSTKLFGYVKKSDASVSFNVKLDYQIQEISKFVRVEATLSNRSSKSLTHITGDLQLESSAYPNFNFVSSLKYQKAQSHLDCTVEINTAPHLKDERNKLTLQFVCTFSKNFEGSKMTTYLLITKPITEIDIKLGLSYHSMANEYKTVGMIRYATGKEMLMTLGLIMPRSSSFFFDAKLNVTLPSFHPLLFSIRLHEKTPNEYDVELGFTWFSGHNFSAKGLYQDRSTAKAVSYNLKLVIKSPSFNEIALSCKLFNSDKEFKADVQADYNQEKYSISLKHVALSSIEFSTILELKYKTSIYAATVTVNLLNRRQIMLDLHLDKHRDVHVALRGLNQPNHKEAGIEIKWDANRDPGQKFAASLEFAAPESMNYSGGFMMAFPGRTVQGSFVFAVKGTNYMSSARLEWSKDDAIDVKMSAMYDCTTNMVFQMKSELLTPFETWKRTSLSAGVRHEGNLFRANGSVYWQDDQNISLDFFSDYHLQNNDMRCEMNVSMISTIPQVSSMSGSFYHKHNNKKYDTNMFLQYKPKQTLAIKSVWEIEENNFSLNLTGTVSLVSTYVGYQKGLLVTKVSVNKDWDIRGAADLELERRKYTLSVDGHLRRITNSMLEFNITTPIDNYQNINGRFGYSEARKHLVAEVKAPAGATGIEILFSFINMSDFDVKFSLCTPIEFLRKAIVIGKLKKDMIDFRCGLNALIIGFSGIWHYDSITDFEYSYKVYTPIAGFEENGIIAKLIHKNGLDFEVALKFTDTKLGIKIQGAPKPKVFKELNLENKKEEKVKLQSSSDYDKKDEKDDDEDNLSWKGLIELDTFLYPTMKGSLDVEQKGTLYTVIASLVLPDGTAELVDELDFIDMFTMTNRLHLTTPCESFKELHSNYNFELEMGVQYGMLLDFKIKSKRDWIESGMNISYTYEIDEDEQIQVHDGKLLIYTPFEALRKLETRASMEIEDKQYRTNLTLWTTQSRATVAANLEVEQGFVELSLSMSMDSPLYKITPFKVMIRKEISNAEQRVFLEFDRLHPALKNFRFESAWHFDPNKYIKARLKVETPFDALPLLETSLLFKNVSDKATYSFDLELCYTAQYRVKVNSELTKNVLTVQFETPIEDFKTSSLEGILLASDGHRTLKGTFKSGEYEYDVIGDLKMTTELPLEVQLILTPKGKQDEITVSLTVRNRADGYEASSSLKHGTQSADIQGGISIRPNYDCNFDLKIGSTHPVYKLFDLNGKLFHPNNGSITAEFSIDTSIKGYEKIIFSGHYSLAPKFGNVKAALDVTQARGDVESAWTWSFMEDMGGYVVMSYDAPTLNITKHIAASGFYKNPRKSLKHLTLGMDVKVDKDDWQFGTNATLELPSSDNIGVSLNLKLPPPQNEIHSFHGRLRYTKTFTYVSQILKYSTHYSKKTYGIFSEGNVTNQAINGNVQLVWGKEQLQVINNILKITRQDKMIDMVYTLRMPRYGTQDTLVGKLFYDMTQDHHNLRTGLFYPSDRFLAGANVDYSSFSNMNGTFNTTTPFKALDYAGLTFKATTNVLRYQRFAEVFWPNKTALFDSNYIYETKDYNTQINGSLVVEVPLHTRHVGKVVYGYKGGTLHTTGYSAVEYNKKRFLEGRYNCDSQSSAGFEKDIMHIEIENDYSRPLGILYIHQFEYSGGMDGFNYPTTDLKKAELFELHNRTSFNLTGEMKVVSTFTGQDITFTAIHSNRTVKLKTNYNFLDHEFKQKSMLQLDSHSWATYDITIVNKTTIEKEEEHLELNFAYPKRNFTVVGYYQLSENSLSSEATFVWDKQAILKKIAGSLDWKRLSTLPNKQHAVISIKHPSFEKDITLNAQYLSDKKNLLDIKTDLVYSTNRNKTVSFAGKLQDISRSKTREYKYELTGTHPATRLDLKTKGEIKMDGIVYQTINMANYKRSFLPLQKGEAKAMLNTELKEIEMEKIYRGEVFYLHGKYTHSNNNPLYMVHGSVVKGYDLNATGHMFVNFNDKMLQAEVNMTPDATQSFHMIGNIPDARNAVFNIWRHYDDISISDIAFYLRLNHSRLVTSKAKWRPEIENEVMTGIEDTFTEIWNGTFKAIDYWKNYIRSETVEGVKSIWSDAKPTIQHFLDDVGELKVLTDDFEEFKIFLNNSYNANEFYVRDIVGITIYLIDELSIRGHIESLPDILNEIWEVMGDSGESIKKSLLWIIETLKNSYKKGVEFINNLLRGDSTGQISALLETVVEKYDQFIKDLHVSFVKHIEDAWNKFSTLLKHHWDNLLHTIEPTFIQIVHYLETATWQASKELLDFLYERKNDIVGSPYFSKFANFTQDVDKVYKDIMKNDTITNIRNYTKIVFDFITERYFTMVPFGKELQGIANEIIGEFKELLKLNSINYAVTKVNLMYEKVMWFYDYFDIGTRLQYAVTLVHSKLTDVTQTALQAENRYREAKTKFIFDPENGNVELEQKLPMSWHAFNETPKFEEIPEYRMMNNVQNYFVTSNTTFWTLYYEYKPYTEPSNWLPPFKAQAMIAGSQQFMTFDNTFFEFKGPCSYLLAHDFVDHNFSAVISYDLSNKMHTYEIIFIVESQVITLDVFHNSLTMERVGVQQLPMEIGDTYIYQEADIVTIESQRGFIMQCNFKFDVCTLTLSGWYFGKTAGLFGTMDNEPSTDFRTPENKQESDIEKFTNKWSLEPKKCPSSKNLAYELDHPDAGVFNKCESFFQTKASQFSPCFPIVDPMPFMRMCLNTRMDTENEPCTSAMAYMQACMMENTPLRIPEACVKCSLVDGTEVAEGVFHRLEHNSVPQSTDVVFIIEAKMCNENLKDKRSIDSLVSLLSKELTDIKLISNRFAVIVFGGDGVYDQPRSVVINNNVFSGPHLIPQYFDHIPTGSGNTDIFGAIRFASKLLFRPGVSKTFILLPCTNCELTNMSLDFTVVHQVLLESDITLHVLMNEEFRFEKDRVSKIFYGMDGGTAYTKKDVKALKGSADLRRQVKLPKSILGYCTPLALETNGTVFTAKKLENDKRNAAKKFISVFAKRVAQSATPQPCQTCECTADNNGLSYMECFPCHYPSPAFIDYGFYEDIPVPRLPLSEPEDELDEIEETPN